MSERRVIGWHGHLVDDVQETGGWAWLRINETLWRRPIRQLLRGALRRWDRSRDG